jgi:hypothetical protein
MAPICAKILKIFSTLLVKIMNPVKVLQCLAGVSSHNRRSRSI